MCGIIGYLGNATCIEKLISGLNLLQNRGYDSVGIGLICDNKLLTIKFASTQVYNSLKTLKFENTCNFK